MEEGGRGEERLRYAVGHNQPPSCLPALSPSLAANICHYRRLSLNIHRCPSPHFNQGDANTTQHGPSH